MDTNTSKDTEQHGNTPENSDVPSYADVVAALESGDNEALGRLMAADEGDEEVTDTADGSEQTDTQEEEPNTNEGDSSQEDESTEATPEAARPNQPAAPAANEDNDIKQELHRLRSELGRVSALQRQVAQLNSELRAERARSSVSGTPNKSDNSNDAPTSTPVKREMPEAFRRKLESVREVDPEIADAMEAMFEATSQPSVDPEQLRREMFEEVQALRQEEEDQRFYAEQLAILEREIPEYRQVFTHPAWAAWKDTLTPGKRALAESPHAEDVIIAIQSFAHAMQAQMNNQGTNQNQPPASSGGGDPNSDTNAGASGNTNVSGARQRKIQASPAVRSTAAKADEPFDRESAFREAYNNRMKELGLVK